MALPPSVPGCQAYRIASASCSTSASTWGRPPKTTSTSFLPSALRAWINLHCTIGSAMSARDAPSPESWAISPTQATMTSASLAASTAWGIRLSSVASSSAEQPAAVGTLWPSSFSTPSSTVTDSSARPRQHQAPIRFFSSAKGPTKATAVSLAMGSTPSFFSSTQDFSAALLASARCSAVGGCCALPSSMPVSGSSNRPSLFFSRSTRFTIRSTVSSCTRPSRTSSSR